MNVFCLVCTFWWFMCMTKWDFYSCSFLPIWFVGERKRRRFLVKILALKTCQLGLMIKGGWCYYIRVGRVLCFELAWLEVFDDVWMNESTICIYLLQFPMRSCGLAGCDGGVDCRLIIKVTFFLWSRSRVPWFGDVNVTCWAMIG